MIARCSQCNVPMWTVSGRGSLCSERCKKRKQRGASPLHVGRDEALLALGRVVSEHYPQGGPILKATVKRYDRGASIASLALLYVVLFNEAVPPE